MLHLPMCSPPKGNWLGSSGGLGCAATRSQRCGALGSGGLGPSPSPRGSRDSDSRDARECAPRCCVWNEKGPQAEETRPAEAKHLQVTPGGQRPNLDPDLGSYGSLIRGWKGCPKGCPSQRDDRELTKAKIQPSLALAPELHPNPTAALSVLCKCCCPSQALFGPAC
jgi:hypothetical protein